VGPHLSGRALASGKKSTGSEQAAEAIALVLASPRRARALADSARALASQEHDPGGVSMAERALGLAATRLGDYDAAVGHLRSSIRIAERAGLDVRGAEARMSLSLVLAYRGDMRQGLREADRAAEILHGEERARLEMQRALILQRLGRLDEALEGYKRALAVIRARGDTLWEARLLNNRALLHAYRGALSAATADLRRAEQLHLSLGQELGAAEVRHNLGFVAARGGDVPAALAWFDSADEDFRAHEVPRAIYLVDRCQVLLSVRLVAEGRQAAERAVAELERVGMAADLAEARLMLSEAALLDGDFESALREAERARAAFTRQQRRSWAALAAYASLRAAWAAGDHGTTTLARARRLARTLPLVGWPLPALDARVIAGRVALALDRTDEARRELARAGKARRRGPVEMRVRAWHAEALLRVASDNRRAAYSALRAGLSLLERHRAALGATELRARVSSHAGELASLGLQLALERGDPTHVLAWSERWRAGGLWLPPVRPPDDAALAADLAELRRVVVAVEEAALAGRATIEAVRRQVALEAKIRGRSWRASGVGEVSVASPPSTSELAQALGERVLVDFVQSGDDELQAVTLSDGKARLHRVGSPREAEAELGALRFALRRLALRRGSPASEDAAAAGAAHAARRLEELLLEPIRAEIGERSLVIVPTGSLHAVPWPLLSSESGRAITVAPSAALWLRASERARARPAGGHVVLAAGPGLAGAEAEVSRLSEQYAGSTLLVGAAARADGVRAALDGAALAHIAAHGHFRADNPLFSSLRMWDGPLTVYDLESLRHAPRTLVLSACDSGLSDVRPGDELMGLAAALFALGTSTVIASVVLVPDDATTPLMSAFHHHLAAGQEPSTALATAQAEVADARYGTLAAAASFVSMGAG